LQSLEERLSTKQDALQERCVVLDEVNTLTEQLRSQAATGRAAGQQLAAEANSYQQQLRSVTRKMMATISELSLYQVCCLLQLAFEWTDP
jgi:outer membrane protein TolC